MTPLEIAEMTSSEVLDCLPEALRADLIEADRVVADPLPNALMMAHEAGGEVLAGRMFLWIDEEVEQGRITQNAEIDAALQQACTRFLALLDVGQQSATIIRPEWIGLGAIRAAVAFRERGRALFIAPVGGTA